MKKEIKNARFDVLKSSKRSKSHSRSHSHSLSLSSSLDENSKKIQKLRIKIKDSKLNKTMPTSLQMDMKSVRVLVERTKFNVMMNLEQNLEHKKSLKCSSTKEIKATANTPLKKLTNKIAPLASSTPQRQQSSPHKSPSKTQPTNSQHQQTIDEIFKIRKCCIKLPKDKLLLRLQEKQIPYPVKLIVHRPRGRPRKIQRDADNLLMVDSPSTGQKRKSSEKQTSVSPPKRKVKKANEFFIKINSLTRVASPRRVPTSNSTSPEEKPPLTSKQRRKTAKKLNTKTLASSRLAPLRQKFGSRFFKSFVKIKRLAANPQKPKMSCSPPKTDSNPKKKNGKNLTVSFLETVEIFGESSDEDDWFESDAKNSSRSIKAPLDSLFDSLKTSTPNIRSSSSASNNSNSSSGSSNGTGSGILKSSILDRKEKKSFSPLKETESPRKQQLKLANESFVPRSLDTQMDEEERDIAEDLTEEAESADKSSTLPENGIVNDKKHKSSKIESQSNESDKSAPKLSSTNKPLTSDDKANEDQNEEKSDSSNNHPNEPAPTKHVTNSVEDEVHAEEEEDEEEEREKEDDGEEEEEEAQTPEDKDDSFRSAATNTTDSSVDGGGPEKSSSHRSPSQTADKDEETEENLADNEEAQSEAEVEPEAKAEEEPSADQNEEPQEDEANHEEISKVACPDDEESFVDPSKLVASVLLHDSTEEGRNEAEAVLNDVCQMAAAESSVLLTPAGHLAYSSPHSAMEDDDDDDDFNSVLTHPQTEKTLQSAAASDLVPNSQEIAVGAAVASQANLVAPTDDDVTEDTFASVVAEVERFTKDVNSEIYADDVGITGTDVMMDNVQVRHSLDDIFDDDVDDDIMSSLRISSGSIDIGHDKSLPIQVIETEVMAIPNEPDLIFDKPLGTTASSLISNGPQLNDTLPGRGVANPVPESNTKLFGRLFQSVKSYVMSPGGDKNSSLQD